MKNELKSTDIARFTTQESNLSYSKSVFAGWEKLLQKTEEFYCLQQNLYMLDVLLAQGKLVLQQVK